MPATSVITSVPASIVQQYQASQPASAQSDSSRANEKRSADKTAEARRVEDQLTQQQAAQRQQDVARVQPVVNVNGQTTGRIISVRAG